MNFRLLLDEELDSKILGVLSKEATDFAQGENPKYKGWAIETLDCNGAEPAMYTNDGKIENLSYTDPNVGIRPSIKYSEIKQNSTVVGIYENECIEVEYGEYPERKLSSLEQDQLTKKLISGKLKKTDKKYSIYSKKDKSIINLLEVIDNQGNKYVLKDGEWYQVSPIRWIVNQQKNLAITKYMIAGGLEYGAYKLPKMTKFEEDFERTHPMKNPPSRRRMYELRKTNKSIIEGFLYSVLPQDIIPSKPKKNKRKYINILQEYLHYTNSEPVLPIVLSYPMYALDIEIPWELFHEDQNTLSKRA